jgi:hypothetical protein
VNLKMMNLLKCKSSINNLLFSVKFFFVIMFLIFSLVRKIIKLKILIFYNFNFWKIIIIPNL